MSLEATPTLAVTCRMADPAIIGATENAARSRSPRRAVSSQLHPGWTLMNSSPPYRPMAS